jgi:molybdenum-dependent DNA-binding transcriptional regulator ModE
MKGKPRGRNGGRRTLRNTTDMIIIDYRGKNSQQRDFDKKHNEDWFFYPKYKADGIQKRTYTLST